MRVWRDTPSALGRTPWRSAHGRCPASQSSAAPPLPRPQHLPDSAAHLAIAPVRAAATAASLCSKSGSVSLGGKPSRQENVRVRCQPQRPAPADPVSHHQRTATLSAVHYTHRGCRALARAVPLRRVGRRDQLLVLKSDVVTVPQGDRHLRCLVTGGQARNHDARRRHSGNSRHRTRLPSTQVHSSGRISTNAMSTGGRGSSLPRGLDPPENSG